MQQKASDLGRRGRVKSLPYQSHATAPVTHNLSFINGPDSTMVLYGSLQRPNLTKTPGMAVFGLISSEHIFRVNMGTICQPPCKILTCMWEIFWGTWKRIDVDAEFKVIYTNIYTKNEPYAQFIGKNNRFSAKVNERKRDPAVSDKTVSLWKWQWRLPNNLRPIKTYELCKNMPDFHIRHISTPLRPTQHRSMLENQDIHTVKI